MKNTIERTLVIIKPDAVQRGLIGQILHRYEKKGLKLVGMKMMQLREAILQEHYAHVVDAPFFEELSYFMGSSPVAILCLEGHDVVSVVRHISGTDSQQLGTIRGDFSVSKQRNLVHSSANKAEAEAEISRFFEASELFEYAKDEWIHSLSQQERE